MGQCIGLDAIRTDIQRQKKDQRSLSGEIEKLRKEIAKMELEFQKSNESVTKKLDDWMSLTEKAEKERTTKETHHQREIAKSIKDIQDLRKEMEQVLHTFGEYKKDNTTILVAIASTGRDPAKLKALVSGEHHHSHHTSHDLAALSGKSTHSEGSGHSTHHHGHNHTHNLHHSQSALVLGSDVHASALESLRDSDEPAHGLHRSNTTAAVSSDARLSVTVEPPASRGGKMSRSKSQAMDGASSSSANGPSKKLKWLDFHLPVVEQGLGFVLGKLSPEEESSLNASRLAMRLQIENPPVVRMIIKGYRDLGDKVNPSRTAGILPGDILEKVDGKQFSSPKEMIEAMKNSSNQVKLTVCRLV